RLAGEEILGLPSHRITDRGVGYVPQGRRIWPSLSVDEHLRLTQRPGKGPWTVARIYQMFPPLAERKNNGGAQLSGGEQQMLAIGRALLLNPRLLVMDEPSEGLAPIIVEQVAETLKSLSAEGEIAVLLVEQNLGVAIDVADSVAVMVNGRIARMMSAGELAADRELQQQLLGVRTAAEYDAEDNGVEGSQPGEIETDGSELRIYTVKRASDVASGVAEHDQGSSQARALRGFTRWNAADPRASQTDRLIAPIGPRDSLLEGQAD